MAQTTSRLGLYLPGGGSTGTNTPDEAADIDKINDNMSKIDAAAGATVCTSGTRPSSPYNGKLIFETDTKYVRVWNAATSNWDLVGGTTYPAANLTGSVAIANGGTGATTVAAAQDSLGVGLVPVVPGSVANSGGTVSVNSMGVITATGVSSLSVNNVFSSDTRKYKIIIYGLGHNNIAADVYFRLRASGTDAITSYYFGQIQVNGTTINGENAANTTHIPVSITQNTQGYGISNIEVYSPANATWTNLMYQYGGWAASTNRYKTGFGFHDQQLAYDGFTLVPTNSAQMTYYMQVFRYNE